MELIFVKIDKGSSGRIIVVRIFVGWLSEILIDLTARERETERERGLQVGRVQAPTTSS